MADYTLSPRWLANLLGCFGFAILLAAAWILLLLLLVLGWRLAWRVTANYSAPISCGSFTISSAIYYSVARGVRPCTAEGRSIATTLHKMSKI
jgi:Na+/H+-dicarboxylate symporter